MKMPPKEKVHEALSAIADDRIELNENSAKVHSSNRAKNYSVDWKDNEYASNDSATFWQGYPGYPVVAILLIQGKLEYDKEILKYFKDINWKKINAKFKNDYAKAAEFALSELDNDTLNYINNEINKIYKSLEDINITIKRSKLYPPS